MPRISIEGWLEDVARRAIRLVTPGRAKRVLGSSYIKNRASTRCYLCDRWWALFEDLIGWFPGPRTRCARPGVTNLEGLRPSQACNLLCFLDFLNSLVEANSNRGPTDVPVDPRESGFWRYQRVVGAPIYVSMW